MLLKAALLLLAGWVLLGGVGGFDFGSAIHIPLLGGLMLLLLAVIKRREP